VGHSTPFQLSAYWSMLKCEYAGVECKKMFGGGMMVVSQQVRNREKFIFDVQYQYKFV
jgi:hypothetical protein